LGRSGQRAEFSQVTGMTLVRCILVKFLGVACHCFPPLFRCSHFSPPGASTSATTWEIPAAEVGNCGRECCPVILPKWLPRHWGIFYIHQIYMGPTALVTEILNNNSGQSTRASAKTIRIRLPKRHSAHSFPTHCIYLWGLKKTNQDFFFILLEDIPLCFSSYNKTYSFLRQKHKKYIRGLEL